MKNPTTATEENIKRARAAFERARLDAKPNDEDLDEMSEQEALNVWKMHNFHVGGHVFNTENGQFGEIIAMGNSVKPYGKTLQPKSLLTVQWPYKKGRISLRNSLSLHVVD